MLLFVISLLYKPLFGEVREWEQFGVVIKMIKLVVAIGFQRGARQVLDMLHTSAYCAPYPPLKTILWSQLRRALPFTAK